jgi:hypothetical protein
MRRVCLLTLIAIALLPAFCPAAVTTTQPFQGVTLIHRTETSPRPLDIHVAIIDTLAPGIHFYATPESPHANDLVIAQTTRSFMTQAAAQLAINGDFYSSAGTFAGFVHRDPSNFAASLGNIYSAFGPPRPAFHVGKNNVAHTVVASGSSGSGLLTPNPNVPVWNAVGGSDHLLQNGAVPTTWRDPAFANALHPRTAIGVSADRTKIAMFVVDGRQPHSGGMNLPEIAAMMRDDYDMHWAINLDGGGSTTMAIADSAPRVLNRPSDGTERSVANSLALFARPLPAPVPPHAHPYTYQQVAGGYSHVGAQILSSDPNSSGIGGAGIRVGYDTVVGRSRGVLSFDLSGIPSDAVIHSASLTLDAFSATGTSNRYVDFGLHQLTDPVLEDQVTWNQATAGNNWTTPGGDVAPLSLSSLYAQQTTGLKTFVNTVAFTNVAQVAFDAGSPLNLLVSAPNAEDWGAANGSSLNMRFRSDDATIGQRPLLKIEYTSAMAPGDFNEDGAVDAADYVAWRKQPTSGPSGNYTTWRTYFNTVPGSGGTATVPEPATWMAGVAGALVVASRRRRMGAMLTTWPAVSASNRVGMRCLTIESCIGISRGR